MVFLHNSMRTMTETASNSTLNIFQLPSHCVNIFGQITKKKTITYYTSQQKNFKKRNLYDLYFFYNIVKMFN